MKTLSKGIYKWLPIVFGCHCLSERSFFYKGKQFPLCARCTGELIGICVGLMGWYLIKLPIYLYVIMLLPLIMDGFIQMFTTYQSDNIKRLLTGILFGIGFASLFLESNSWFFHQGFRWGMSIK